MRLKWAYAFALIGATLSAQETQGSISGVVVDPSDAVIPNALISIANSSLETRSGPIGEFVLSGLEPGLYHVKFETPGFKVKELDVSVEAGKETTLGRVRIDLGPVAPCVGRALKPQTSRTKLVSGGKARIVGDARGDRGYGLKNLTVLLTSAGAKPVVMTDTDEDGKFQFLNVALGFYNLEGSWQDEPLIQIRALRVPTGNEVKVRLRWAQPQICL